MTLKEQIAAANDSGLEAVEVPEWQTTVYIKVMSGAERGKWRKAPGAFVEETSVATLLAFTLCDAQGNRIYGDDEIAAIDAKNAVVTQRLFALARHKNALGGDETDDAKKTTAL